MHHNVRFYLTPGHGETNLIVFFFITGVGMHLIESFCSDIFGSALILIKQHIDAIFPFLCIYLLVNFMVYFF